MTVSTFVALLPKEMEIILFSFEDRIASSFMGHQFKMTKSPLSFKELGLKALQLLTARNKIISELEVKDFGSLAIFEYLLWEGEVCWAMCPFRRENPLWGAQDSKCTIIQLFNKPAWEQDRLATLWMSGYTAA